MELFSRRKFLGRMGFGIAGLSLAGCQYLKPEHVAPGKPNVLFIAVDDLNDWIGCMGGHGQAKTPNIANVSKLGRVRFGLSLTNPGNHWVISGLEIEAAAA